MSTSKFKFEFKFDSEDSRELTYLEDKFGLISDWTISCLASEDLLPIFFLLIFIFNPLSTVAWCSTVLAAFAADGEDEDEEEEDIIMKEKEVEEKFDRSRPRFRKSRARKRWVMKKYNEGHKKNQF